MKSLEQVLEEMESMDDERKGTVKLPLEASGLMIRPVRRWLKQAQFIYSNQLDIQVEEVRSWWLDADFFVTAYGEARVLRYFVRDVKTFVDSQGG